MWFCLLCVILILLLTGCGESTADSNNVEDVTKKGADSTPVDVVRATYEAVKDNPTETEMQDTIYRMQKRIENLKSNLDSTEVAIYQDGANRVTVDIPDISNPKKILQELGKPGTLQFILYEDLKSKDGDAPSEGDEVVYDKEKVLMTGDMIDEATATTQQKNVSDTTENVIQIKFKGMGVKKFAEITGDHVGENLAIIYDDKLVSFPTVQQEISGGECIISGSFSLEEAETLASTLRIGALPFEMKLIEVTNP